MKKKILHFLLPILFFSINTPVCNSQVDSSYVQPFEQDFSTRIYSFNKFAGFTNEGINDRIDYKTNKPSSIGLGISWKHYALNFSYGFDILKSKKKGNTKSLEFEYHGYKQKIAYDIFLQHHKGFYNDQQNSDKSYTLYPDLSLQMYGGGMQYIFNNKKFSYRAAFSQNERQIKSAGSLLLGGSIYYSKVRSDATTLFEGMNENHKNLQFGFSVGYAYTWVFSKHWFATASFTGGATIGNNFPSRFFKERMQVYPTLNGRFALGYDAKDWSIGTLFHTNKVYLFYEDKQSLSMNNTQIQLTFIKRFHWKNKFVNETLNKTKEKLRL